MSLFVRTENNELLGVSEPFIDNEKNALIDKVLEIIEKEDDYFDQLIRRGEVADLDDIYERMRDAVEALRGGEQE